MSEKDRRLIEKARCIGYMDACLISGLMDEAESREAMETLRCIRASKHHTEEYCAGML